VFLGGCIDVSLMYHAFDTRSESLLIVRYIADVSARQVVSFPAEEMNSESRNCERD